MDTEDMTNYPEWKLQAIIAIASGEWKHSANSDEISRAKQARKVLASRRKNQKMEN